MRCPFRAELRGISGGRQRAPDELRPRPYQLDRFPASMENAGREGRLSRQTYQYLFTIGESVARRPCRHPGIRDRFPYTDTAPVDGWTGIEAGFGSSLQHDMVSKRLDFRENRRGRPPGVPQSPPIRRGANPVAHSLDYPLNRERNWTLSHEAGWTPASDLQLFR